jgi:hypothetical protein
LGTLIPSKNTNSRYFSTSSKVTTLQKEFLFLTEKLLLELNGIQSKGLKWMHNYFGLPKVTITTDVANIEWRVWCRDYIAQRVWFQVEKRIKAI